MKKLVAMCFLLGALISCGGSSSSDSSGGGGCGNLGARIFNGESCDQNAQTPVVALFPVATDGTQIGIAGICTGALVTLNQFVTSAHCFIDPVNELGDAILGFAVIVGGADGEAFRVGRLATHPLYNGRPGSPYDVAMGELEGLPNPPIGPLAIGVSQDTEVSNVLTAFGYGTNNDGEIGELKAADIRIDEIADGNLVGTLGTSGASICPGDSGGPLVKTIGGVSSLVGVNSFIGSEDGTCGGEGAAISGFVDVQNPEVLDFIIGLAPGVQDNFQ